MDFSPISLRIVERHVIWILLLFSVVELPNVYIACFDLSINQSKVLPLYTKHLWRLNVYFNWLECILQESWLLLVAA